MVLRAECHEFGIGKGWNNAGMFEVVQCSLQAWNLTGDAFTHNPGDKPWISEMYGYSFGTASAGVWHHVDYEAMLYPGYTTYGAYLPSSRHLPASSSLLLVNLLHVENTRMHLSIMEMHHNFSEQRQLCSHQRFTS